MGDECRRFWGATSRFACVTLDDGGGHASVIDHLGCITSSHTRPTSASAITNGGSPA